jgi:hypothetical protein
VLTRKRIFCICNILLLERLALKRARVSRLPRYLIEKLAFDYQGYQESIKEVSSSISADYAARPDCDVSSTAHNASWTARWVVIYAAMLQMAVNHTPYIHYMYIQIHACQACLPQPYGHTEVYVASRALWFQGLLRTWS